MICSQEGLDRDTAGLRTQNLEIKKKKPTQGWGPSEWEKHRGGQPRAREKALSNALAGMDEALLKVVEANKVALQKLTEGGASFEESSVKKGLKELEAFEEKFLDGVKQAAQEASDRTKEQWKSILDNIPRGGTDTGAQVKETLGAHAREAQAAIRSSREAGLKVMHTLTQNYATLVSGVLIGLSEALEHGKPKTKH